MVLLFCAVISEWNMNVKIAQDDNDDYKNVNGDLC